MNRYYWLSLFINVEHIISQFCLSTYYNQEHTLCPHDILAVTNILIAFLLLL